MTKEELKTVSKLLNVDLVEYFENLGKECTNIDVTLEVGGFVLEYTIHHDENNTKSKSVFFAH